MSRIGSKKITVPAGVKVVEENGVAVVTGKLGTLRIPIPSQIAMKVEDSTVSFECKDATSQTNALHGLTRSLVNNAVIGVVSGYKKELGIVGVGYKATLEGKKLVLNIGYSTLPYPCSPLACRSISSTTISWISPKVEQYFSTSQGSLVWK